MLLGTNCQPFFVAVAAPQGHLSYRGARRDSSPQLPSAAQRYNTLDFVTKVVCHETPARFLWILPAIALPPGFRHSRCGRQLVHMIELSFALITKTFWLPQQSGFRAEDI